MGYFDFVGDSVRKIFGERSPWITWTSPSKLDLTVCQGRARADEDMRVCALCVSVNHCYFCNEYKKKPMLPKYPHCKCNAVRRDPPDPSEITLDFPKEKLPDANSGRTLLEVCLFGAFVPCHARRRHRYAFA